MRRAIWLYGRFFRQHLLSMLEYQTSFVIMLAAGLMIHAPGLIFLYVIYEQIPAIQGWTREQLVFIYALMFFTEGLCSTFVEGIWQMTWVVHEGRLDHYLLRPVSPLLSVMCQRVGMHGFGMIVVGGVLLANALASGIVVSPAMLLLVPAILVCGFLIRAAIVLITNCSVFWFPGMGISLAVAVNDISDFAKYPTTIYALGIQALITWVLPFAFVAAIPAAALAGRSGGELIWALPIVTLVLCVVAIIIFRRGVRRYEGAGH